MKATHYVTITRLTRPKYHRHGRPTGLKSLTLKGSFAKMSMLFDVVSPSTARDAVLRVSMGQITRDAHGKVVEPE
jgi:hypothetical protein